MSMRGSVHKANVLNFIAIALLAFTIAAPSMRAQSPNTTPDWCGQLPRPEYKPLERVHSIDRLVDPWFEVYRVVPEVFAIYEPHQFEETISFLILGKKRAVLFDTGLGIGDIKRVALSLTSLPLVVINSHTHNDHVGGNWEFRGANEAIYGMDTAFTRTNAKGSTVDAQAELAAGSICGQLPAGFDAKSYATRPFHITRWIHDGEKIDLGGRVLEVISTPGHTPDAICLLDRKNGLLFTGDTFYAGPIWLYRPETDLNAYINSVAKIAALAPSLHLLVPSHNVPQADPAQLPKLLAAIKRVRAGEIKSVSAGEGKVHYNVDGFVFLMAAPKYN
jgi:glyoxylase-like metal-dependent hydrolase (beta-lactamase superfamily II)